MQNKKLYIAGGSQYEALSHSRWLRMELVPTIELADLVLFRGGDDVDPELYNEPRHPRTQTPNSARDKFEVREFNVAKHLGKHLIGVCRGAQFLCVMAGGKLVQHQEEHGDHAITCFSEEAITRKVYAMSATSEITVTSSHHQAQFPWGIKDRAYKVLGWTENLSHFHINGQGGEMVNDADCIADSLVEVEICFYPQIKALGIQSHPEWPHDKSGDYMRMLVDLHLNNKL